jgi:hypothetical protein
MSCLIALSSRLVADFRFAFGIPISGCACREILTRDATQPGPAELGPALARAPLAPCLSPYARPLPSLPFSHSILPRTNFLFSTSLSSPCGALGFGDGDHRIWIPEVSSPPLSLSLPLSPLLSPARGPWCPCARPHPSPRARASLRAAPCRGGAAPPLLPCVVRGPPRPPGEAVRPLPNPLARQHDPSPAPWHGAWPRSGPPALAPWLPGPGGAAPRPPRARPLGRGSTAPLRAAPSTPCAAGSPVPPARGPRRTAPAPRAAWSSARPPATRPLAACPTRSRAQPQRAAIKFQFNWF